MLSKEELDQISGHIAKKLGYAEKQDVDLACSACGLTMEESKLLASRRDGEVVIVSTETYKDTISAVELLRRIATLDNDPHPGLITWVGARRKVHEDAVKLLGL